MALSQYHQIIRKYDISFSDLFNDVTIARYEEDQNILKQFKIPLVFSDKEKFISRLQTDPDFTMKVSSAIPKMSWEKIAMRYNSKRKLNSNQKETFCVNGIPNMVYNAIPYDFHYNLYIYARSMEDGNQVLEYILPFFDPSLTLRINLIPEINMVKEVPIILENVDLEFNSEGGGYESDTRTLIWTLPFVVQGYIYGDVTQPKVIKHAISDIYSNILDDSINISTNNGIGTYKVGETVFTGLSLSNYTAKGTISSIANNILNINNIDGNFNIGNYLKGKDSLASKIIINISNNYQKIITYTADVDPANSTPMDNYRIIETLTENE